MIDTQDVTAVSSPAQDAPADSSAAPTEQPSYRSLNELSPKQRQHWRETGEHPDDKQTEPEASSPSSEATPPEPAPDSQPAPQERKARNSHENRVKELLDQQKTRDTEIASLRAEIERLTKSPKADVPAVPSTAQPTKEAKTEDAKPDSRVGPDGQPWKSWNDYQEALLAWNRREAVRESQAAFQKTERDRQAAELNKKIEDSWKGRVNDTIKKLGVKPEDYAKVAFNKDLPINKATDGFILDSQHGAELLYHLGQNPQLAAEVAKLDPIATIRLLTRLEMALSGETSTPQPKTTRTPPPPTDLGARNTPPKDEAEAAAARGDYATYKRLMNKQDVEAAKTR